jgi:acyl dehydratase
MAERRLFRLTCQLRDLKMPTRYYEDFDVGDEWTFDPWSLDEATLVDFARQYDPQPMHLDAAAAADGPHGGLIASGWQTALGCVTPFLRAVMTETAGLASPGFEEFRWLKPVWPGDPITPKTKVLEKRVSKSKPDLGIVRFEFSGTNSDGDIVWRADGLFFISVRP